MNHLSGKILLSTIVSLGLLVNASSEATAAMDSRGCLQTYYMKSYAKALPLCLLAAKAGHEQSQFVLGMMYAGGKGTPRSYQAATRWLKAASQQGHLAARYKIQKLENELSDAARRDMTSSFWLHHKPMPVEKYKEEAIVEEKAERTESSVVKKNALQIEVFADPTSIKPSYIKIIETVPEQPMPVQKSSGDEPVKEDFSKSWPQYEGLNSSETSEIAEMMARDMAESYKK